MEINSCVSDGFSCYLLLNQRNHFFHPFALCEVTDIHRPSGSGFRPRWSGSAPSSCLSAAQGGCSHSDATQRPSQPQPRPPPPSSSPTFSPRLPSVYLLMSTAHREVSCLSSPETQLSPVSSTCKLHLRPGRLSPLLL